MPGTPARTAPTEPAVPARELLRDVTIEGFKSIAKASFQLGRTNVFIGENGSGKTNILEALAIASASSELKLDHEFLASRGVRSVDPTRMATLLRGASDSRMGIWLGTGSARWEVWNLDVLAGVERAATVFPEPFREIRDKQLELRRRLEEINRLLVGGSPDVDRLDQLIAARLSESQALEQRTTEALKRMGLDPNTEAPNDPGLREPSVARFLVFSPEYAALQTFRDEGQILPVGIHGEGLFAHLKALAKQHPDVVDAIDRELRLLDWFDGFAVPRDLGPGEKRLDLRDRFLVEGATLDHRSANEGFLFLLLLFTLMHSPETPPFFAIDNVDTALNPRLCTAVVRRMAALASENDKQILLTTHNPHVLDGLDLTDDEQRLFAVSRTSAGATRVRRIPAPKPLDGDEPIRLSEAFVQGFLGGLPKNF